MLHKYVLSTGRLPQPVYRLYIPDSTAHKFTMAFTPFESRVGSYQFHTPREAMGYSGQVVRWANINRLPLYFNYSKIGSDHSPLWIAAPVREYL